jgi:threonine/homoserine/homoserine lactone efflux protein
MNPFTVITTAIIITIIGALPFGLVNLTVLDISFHRNRIAALKVAHGAAWIEVLFGLTALIAGSLIAQYTRDHRVVQTLVLIIPALVGLAFLLKKNRSEAKTSKKDPGFLKGMMLNLISIQVLLYWLFAMTYFNTRWEPEFNILFIALFALGIWIGKMGVLWVYALLSQKIFSRFGFLAKNINRVIGVVLLITVFIQFFK